MKKQKSKEQITLEAVLGSQTVSFYPEFARTFGSVTAGVFISQGFFWQFKAEYKDTIQIGDLTYFSKSAIEWERATALSDEQQKLARNTLIKVGVLREVRAGMPARMYFNFDFDALVDAVSSYLSTGLPVSGKHGNKIPGNLETLIRETREQDSGKHGDTIIGREYNERLESLEREAQAPNSHPQPNEIPELSSNPLQFEEKEKNTPPNSAPPPIKKEPRKKQSYTPDQVYELLPESVKPFFEAVCQNGALKTYLEYRRDQHKFSYNSAKAASIMIKSLYEFSGGDPDKAVLVVEQSIANGWKGIFKIKDSGQRKPAHIQNQQDLLSYVLANREKVWRESAGQ